MKVKISNFPTLTSSPRFFPLKWQTYKVTEAYIFWMTYCIDTSIVPPLHTHNTKVERVPHRRFRKWYANLLPGTPTTTYHLPPTTWLTLSYPRHTHFLAIIWENNSYSPKCWCTYQHSPTIKTTTNTQLHSTYQKGSHWYLEILGSEAMENFWGDFASDGTDFDTADGNSYKDYYSGDDDLFSLDDVSHSEVRDMREAWNALT